LLGRARDASTILPRAARLVQSDFVQSAGDLGFLEAQPATQLLDQLRPLAHTNATVCLIDAAARQNEGKIEGGGKSRDWEAKRATH
jgi:hypothetical protein